MPAQRAAALLAALELSGCAPAWPPPALQVCATPCDASSQDCSALETFALRVDDKLASSPEYIKSISDGGSLVPGCNSLGELRGG